MTALLRCLRETAYSIHGILSNLARSLQFPGCFHESCHSWLVSFLHANLDGDYLDCGLCLKENMAGSHALLPQVSNPSRVEG